MSYFCRIKQNMNHQIQTTMEKNILLSESTPSARLNYQHVIGKLLMPIELLRRYYAKVMEREVNTRQTLLLLNAQLAFVMTVFPIEAPFAVRVVCCLWLLNALWKCKQAF